MKNVTYSISVKFCAPGLRGFIKFLTLQCGYYNLSLPPHSNVPSAWQECCGDFETSKVYADGGTNSGVRIQLVGEDGTTTEKHDLDHFWRNDFEQGRTDDFGFEDKDVGRLVMIRLQLEHERKIDGWACDNIVVRRGSTVDEFPVYDWVIHNMEILKGEALLPQSIESKLVRESIKKERRENKTRYSWMEKAKPGDPAWMLPRFIPAEDVLSVPHQLKMEDSRFQHMQDLRCAAKFNVIVETLKGWMCPIKELEDYKNLFSHFEIPSDLQPCIDKWQEDEEQGRQMLNGANPFTLERCNELPDYCKIENKHIKGLLNEGKTLDDEIADGRIFIVDYCPLTKDLPRNKQYKSDKMLHCADVVALFYSPGDGKFRPIAIQLEPENEKAIFTPNDEKYDWMLAKMYFRCADSNVHQWIYHFLWCHGIVETAATSMFRCLSRTHPMYKLCRAHLQYVVVINQFARDVLIFESSPSNYTRSINGSSLARRAFKDFDFEDLNFPKLLKKKGLDSLKLENYHYRHDASLLWDAIKKYLTKIVKIYYKTDQDVQKDTQIQDWVKDLANEGFGSADGNTRGCPTSLKTVRELATFVTCIIFTSCVQHIATHKPIFDLYKFIPNAPGGMRMSIHKKKEGTVQRVLDSLPDITMATLLFGSAFVLTELPKDEIYLGEFPMKLFTEAEPREVLKEFANELKEISEKIKERNEQIEFPYEYLLPENIPTGTTA